ncbi:MAG TPA: hypothetical protein VN181_01735 [Thermoanaerobaculia bacterium]|nr:hypothetical protein [Thermoanaerobaculia bacterium]
MPALDAAIVAHLTDTEQKTPMIVVVETAVVRYWTNYRGRCADGRRGLVITDALLGVHSGAYFPAHNIEVPGINEGEEAPPAVTITIGNADNAAMDLYSNADNVRKPVKIWKVHVLDATVIESIPPASVKLEPWFDGLIGRPSFQGEQLVLDCRMDFGRQGVSPRTRSKSLMVSHETLVPGKKSVVG